MKYLLSISGIVLAAIGHSQWWLSKMSPANKVGFLMWIIPGWALITMGYMKYLQGCKESKEKDKE